MLNPNVQGFFEPITGTWTYVVWAEGHIDKRCAIIDSVLDYDIHSGQTQTHSADIVIDFIQSKGLTVQWILETHVHADHLTASQYLQEKLGGLAGISEHILAVIKVWRPIFQAEMDMPLDGSQFDKLFADEEQFSVGPLSARIIYTPGHTPSDTTYIIENCAFVGDALFMPDVGTGRCDFPGGNASDSFESTHKILSLPGDYRLYVGHDYPSEKSRKPQCMSTVADQKRTNSRVRDGISKAEYVLKRNHDDQGKSVPKLLFPALQVNLRRGSFGQAVEGIQFIKLPVNCPLIKVSKKN